MTEENEDFNANTPHRGRTWADVFVGTSYLAAGLLFLIVAGAFAYFLFGRIPNWFFIAIIGSLLFIPFLFERAKDSAELFIVIDEPFKLTEYRIGKRTGLSIDGNPIQFVSKSGVYRSCLTSFDDQKLRAKAPMFGGFTQLDQIRDLTTLQRITNTLEETLRENRVSSQEVGVEVEKRSIEIVDWALKTIFGAIVPTEVSEAFGVVDEEPAVNFEETLEGEVEIIET